MGLGRLFDGPGNGQWRIFVVNSRKKLSVSSNGRPAVAETLRTSAAELHKKWVKLENEQHRVAIAIEKAKIDGFDPEPLRLEQARLLLEINAVVAVMQDAPATTVNDFVALLDVALEHELDLASEIAFYGPKDYPMIARLLRALASNAPGFQFNSLGRWLSRDQFEHLMGKACCTLQTSRNCRSIARPTHTSG